eukprot:gene3955-4232_t
MRLSLPLVTVYIKILILIQYFVYVPCSIIGFNPSMKALAWWKSSNTSAISTTPISKNLDKMIAITFVNGIYHSFEECQNLSKILEDAFGVKVYPFYNPSSGSWVKDFSRASVDLALRSSEIVLAKNLTEHFRKVFQTLDPKGRILHLAHSGGATLTYIAAKHHLTIAETNRIDVVTFGGGKSITRKYFKGGRVCNYYSRNDPLTIIDRRTNDLLKQYESNCELEAEIEDEDSYGVIQDPKHNTTFIFLQSRANHPITDHSMFGPTYLYAIELEARILKQQIQRLLLQDEKEKSLIRKVRKLSANITGLHHFWDWKIVEKYYYNSTYNELHPPWRSTLRSFRQTAANITHIHGLFSGKYREKVQEGRVEQWVEPEPVVENQVKNTDDSSLLILNDPKEEETDQYGAVHLIDALNQNEEKYMQDHELVKPIAQHIQNQNLRDPFAFDFNYISFSE